MKKEMLLNFEPLLQRARYELAMNRFEEAELLLAEARRLRPDAGIAWFLTGECLAGGDRFDEALKAYREALKLEPENPDYLTGLGGCYACLQQPEKSRAALERSYELDPDAMKTIGLLITCYFNYGLWKQCDVLIERVLEVHRDFWMPHFYRGMIYAAQDRPAEALPHLERALELGPGEDELWASTASVHSALSQFELAEDWIRRAKEIFGSTTALIAAEAFNLHRQGRYEEAIKRYEEALSGDGEQPGIFYNRACSLSRLGRFEDALVDLRRVRPLVPMLMIKAKSDPDFQGMAELPGFRKLVT